MSFGHGDNSAGPLWTWTQPKEKSLPFVKRALAAGINFFDTAINYSLGASEVILGQCLKELNVHREDVVIASKFSFPYREGTGPNRNGRSRKHIMAAVEESLKHLGTHYIDLYIIHKWGLDAHTSYEETMGALNDLVQSGKIRYIGVSNIAGWQLVKANAIAEKYGWAKIVCVQNLYNLIYRDDEREVIPACLDLGVAYTPWSPLHMGFLTGSRKKGEKTDTLRGQSMELELPFMNPKELDWLVIDRVVELAAKKGVSPAQLALAWNLSKPFVTSPVIGVSKESQLEDAITAIKIKLTEEDLKFLEEKYLPKIAHPFGVY
jgi:aryl-alcohol dehydrogenase-like predicted oxidoreductase